VQRAELLDDEEQEDDHGPVGAEEVLQPLPQASGPQGIEVKRVHCSQFTARFVKLF
jgi:hypothetical protein